MTCIEKVEIQRRCTRKLFRGVVECRLCGMYCGDDPLEVSVEFGTHAQGLAALSRFRWICDECAITIARAVDNKNADSE